MSVFSRLSDDFRHTLIGLAVGILFLALFVALGLGVVGAVLAPIVAVGVNVLSSEASHRKESSEAERNLDARYRDAEAYLANREAWQKERSLRVERMRKLQTEKQQKARGQQPELSSKVSRDTYLEDQQRFNKRLSEVVHNLSPFKAESTTWTQVQGELQQVLTKLRAGAALIQELEDEGIETAEKGQQFRRLTEVLTRLGKHKTELVSRSLISRFRDWNKQLLWLTQDSAPLVELETETAITAWLDFRVRPEKQPFGVSHEGAEHLVAEWLEYLGHSNVEVTQFIGDGGVDVETDDLVVQVKNYGQGGVSSSELRDLLGTATAAGRGAALFTSSRLTKDARAFAESNNIACIAYDAKLSQLSPLTLAGQRLLDQGHYADAV